MTVVTRSGKPVLEHQGRLQHLGIQAQSLLPAFLSSPAWATQLVGGSMGASKSRIKTFIQDYGLRWQEASRCGDVKTMDECVARFADLNDFFARQIAGIRIARPSDERTLTSQAQCRLMVFDSFDSSTVWVKGKNWSVASLLGTKTPPVDLRDCYVAIFRLAPQDYHRVHTPCGCTIVSARAIDGSFLSVHPDVVGSARDVYTHNARMVFHMRNRLLGDFYTVMVGAAMVGSIVRTAPVRKRLKKGQEFGMYQFGGSTNVMLIPKGGHVIKFDAALLRHSRKNVETLVNVGDRIATVV